MNRSIQSHSRSQFKSKLPYCFLVLLITLAVLLLACFSAFTYYSADEKFKDSLREKEASQAYYAAETTATQLIEEYSKARSMTASSLNGRSEQKTPQGTIEITKIDGTIYFAVPVNKTEVLQVEAKVTRDRIDIKKWFIERT